MRVYILKKFKKNKVEELFVKYHLEEFCFHSDYLLILIVIINFIGIILENGDILDNSKTTAVNNTEGKNTFEEMKEKGVITELAVIPAILILE